LTLCRVKQYINIDTEFKFPEENNENCN